MPEDATIVLRAIDETGAPMSRVVANARRMQGEIRAAMFGVTRGYDEQGRAAEAMGRRAEGAHGRAARAAQQHTSAIQDMIVPYARAALSFETARRSMLGFADTDERLRRMRNQAGATADEMKRVGEAARILSRETGQSLDDLISGFDKFRDFAGLSVNEGLKIFPAIARGAQALGVSVDDMSASVSAMMVNANLQGKDVVKVIDQMTKAGQDYRLEFNQLVKSAPRLTEVMGEWGYTGVRGNAAALAWLASLRKVSSGTDEAAEALSKVMELMTNPAVAEKLGHTPDTMADGLKRAQAQGKDTLSVFLDVVAQAEKNGTNLSEIFSKRDIRFIRQLMRDRRDIKDWSADIQNSTGTADNSFRVWAEGSKKSILDVTNEIKNLQDAFGEFIVSLGAVDAIGLAATEIKEMSEAIETVSKAVPVIVDAMKNLDLSKFNALNNINWKPLLDTFSRLSITGQAMSVYDRIFGKGNKKPELPSDDTQSGKADKLSVTPRPGGREQPWKLSEEEQKEIDRKRRLNEAAEKLDAIFRRMSFTLEDFRTGEPRIMQASLGGGAGYGGIGGAGAYGGGPGGFGPGGGGFGPGGVPYAGGGRFGGAGLGALGRGGYGSGTGRMPPLPGDAPMMPRGGGMPGFGAGASGRGGIGGGPGGGPGAMDKQQLRGQLEKEITNSPLNGFVPPDGERYGIKTGSPKEWSHFMTELAGKESGYKPGAVGDVGSFGGHGSRGLFQLSPQDAQTYGLNRGKPFSYDQLHDPATNMRAAVDIMNQRVRQGGIGGRQGAAAYWGPLQRGWTPGPMQGDGGQIGGGGQGYNYFQKRGASPLQSGQLTPVDTPYGRVLAHPHAADDVRGFFGELGEHGAPLSKPGSYNFRQKRWGGGWSSHAYGTAFDLDDQQFLSPQMKQWIAQNPQRWADIKSKYNMGQPLPEKDPAHVEWRGPPPRIDAARRGEQTIPPAASQGDTWGRGAQPAPYMGEGGGALGSFGRGGSPEQGGGASPFERSSAVDDAMRARQELERPIRVNMDMGGSTQFGRASMRREADREVREARFNSSQDIGAA